MPEPWAGLELRHLVALCAVADQGTISRAAAGLGYTQSAVSQQIAGLERAVGAPVFDRPGGPRRLVLTEVGEALLEHSRAILGRLRTAEADVRSVVAGERGVLRVGILQSVGTRVLPDVLRRFHDERPGVEVSLRESHDPEILLGLVADGELDATFAELRVVFRSDDNTTIQGCVGAGLGYALVPLLAVDVDDPAVRVVALDPPAPPRVICMVWSADRRPPATLEPFLGCVAETCDRIAAGWSGRKQVPA